MVYLKFHEYVKDLAQAKGGDAQADLIGTEKDGKRAPIGCTQADYEQWVATDYETSRECHKLKGSEPMDQEQYKQWHLDRVQAHAKRQATPRTPVAGVM